MRFFIDDLLRNTGVEVRVGLELKDDVQDVHQQKDLIRQRGKLIVKSSLMLTTLVPRLTLRVFRSAFTLLDHEAWNAV